MTRRLVVIDGADQGQCFVLPEAGTVVVGNRRNCDICLHDLYVARSHFEVEVAEEWVRVLALDTPNGTLVNGVKVSACELHLGDVIRAGNSHLRLELVDGSGPAAAAVAEEPPPAEEPWHLEALPLDRMAELSGHPLGHYELGEVLGQGHCGVVFRATDLKKNLEVALKVLAPAFPADDGEMQRFIRTAKPLLPLRHPNLVPLHGAGKNGPYVWIDQELVDGESLTSVLEYLRTAEKIKWRRAWRVALGLARALEFLFRHHVVHGNITPANVLIQLEDGRPRLNDLILNAGLVGTRLQEATMEQKLLAELPYLSPEHVDLDSWIDEQSDQYSVGAIVYALLTGRPPFEAEAPEDTLEHIRTATPKNPKSLQPDIPDGLKTAVLRMLAKHPEDRYPNPAELLADLEQLDEDNEES
jgi:serine/threonine protein kinase